jgi:plastocyanin
VSGTVTVSGGSLENAVVYVETVRDRLARGRHEIRQVSKQFTPRFSVVPRGTTVSFPNQDSIFHNVFSLSPGNTFDLGTYRSGDKPGEVSLNSTGVVQVFCNLHSQMSASVLVTPSRLYAVVDKSGAFQLDNIPVGKHRLVAWMPKASEPVTQEVEITSEGASPLSFNLTARSTDGAHTNKHGQPYGSYQQ